MRPLVIFVIIPIILIIFSSNFPVVDLPSFNLDTSISSPYDIWRIIVDFHNISISNLFKTSYWITLVIYFLMFAVVLIAYFKQIKYIFIRIGLWLDEDKPLIDSKFFSFWKPEDAITELKYIEKLAYIAIPVIIFINLVSYTAYFFPNVWDDILKEYFGNISFTRLFAINIIVNAFLTTLLYFFIIFLSRSFRFYFAKTFIIVAQTKTDKLDKMKYYMDGIKTYNKFLSRNFRIRLDEPKIYSSFFTSYTIDEKLLLSSFDERDQLHPIRWLKKFIRQNDLVIQDTNLQMIKDSIEFMLGVLPLVFTVLALILPSYADILNKLAG